MPVESHGVDFAFRVYGDNILECLSLIEWIDNGDSSGFVRRETVGTIDRPIYVFESYKSPKGFYAFQLCPYYGNNSSRWPNDPLAGVFKEKPDIVVTRVCEGLIETSGVFAVESCDAIQAGNQAWQRFRRAYSAADAGLPYLYVLPVIGWERDSGGLELAQPRHQSAQVTLAQLTLCSMLGVPSLQLFTPSSWLQFARQEGEDVPEEGDVVTDGRDAGRLVGALLRRSILGHVDELTDIKESLRLATYRMMMISKAYCDFKNTHLPLHAGHPAFRSKEDAWKASGVYAEAILGAKPVSGEYALHNLGVSDVEERGALSNKIVHQKTTSATFADKVIRWLNWKNSGSYNAWCTHLRKWGVEVPDGATKEELRALAEENRGQVPVSYKAGRSEAFFVANREAFRSILQEGYAGLSSEVLDWVCPAGGEQRPLVTVPLYAYKPSGDSRPDRGLLPFLAALLPRLTSNRNVLVIVYSKHTPVDWKDIIESESNELWNAVKLFAGAVIVDRTGDGILLTGAEEC